MFPHILIYLTWTILSALSLSAMISGEEERDQKKLTQTGKPPQNVTHYSPSNREGGYSEIRYSPSPHRYSQTPTSYQFPASSHTSSLISPRPNHQPFHHTYQPPYYTLPSTFTGPLYPPQTTQHNTQPPHASQTPSYTPCVQKKFCNNPFCEHNPCWSERVGPHAKTDVPQKNLPSYGTHQRTKMPQKTMVEAFPHLQLTQNTTTKGQVSPIRQKQDPLLDYMFMPKDQTPKEHTPTPRKKWNKSPLVLQNISPVMQQTPKNVIPQTTKNQPTKKMPEEKRKIFSPPLKQTPPHQDILYPGVKHRVLSFYPTNTQKNYTYTPRHTSPHFPPTYSPSTYPKQQNSPLRKTPRGHNPSPNDKFFTSYKKSLVHREKAPLKKAYQGTSQVPAHNPQESVKDPSLNSTSPGYRYSYISPKRKSPSPSPRSFLHRPKDRYYTERKTSVNMPPRYEDLSFKISVPSLPLGQKIGQTSPASPSPRYYTPKASVQKNVLPQGLKQSFRIDKFAQRASKILQEKKFQTHVTLTTQPNQDEEPIQGCRTQPGTPLKNSTYKNILTNPLENLNNKETILQDLPLIREARTHKKASTPKNTNILTISFCPNPQTLQTMEQVESKKLSSVYDPTYMPSSSSILNQKPRQTADNFGFNHPGPEQHVSNPLPSTNVKINQTQGPSQTKTTLFGLPLVLETVTPAEPEEEEKQK